MVCDIINQFQKISDCPFRNTERQCFAAIPSIALHFAHLTKEANLRQSCPAFSFRQDDNVLDADVDIATFRFHIDPEPGNSRKLLFKHNVPDASIFEFLDETRVVRMVMRDA
jgi:hypothetical protein